MSVVARCLVESAFTSDTETLVYTSPSNIVTIIDKFTATNISNSDIQYYIYLVPKGESFGDSNKIVGGRTITAHTIHDFTELQNQILMIGDMIYAKASSGDSTVIRVSGRQVS